MGTFGVISAAFSALMDAVWSGAYSAIRPLQFLVGFFHYHSQVPFHLHCSYFISIFRILGWERGNFLSKCEIRAYYRTSYLYSTTNISAVSAIVGDELVL